MDAMNRLRAATSPYLLQHADNPVDWWEWGPEAVEEARRRDVPVLLSVGYAACHWCHVMAHESFEDAATAAQMNEQFVSVKVDREERPDVDAIYMQATTAMTGHGGWPMTVVLDHDANPWFAGTYFPDTPRHGQASFRQVLQAVTDAWRDRRDGVRQQAAQLREHLQAPATLPASPIGADEVDAAIGRLGQDFDAAAGGFGGAPKFPPSLVLELLRRRAARADDEVGRQAAHMLGRTVEAMAGGGIYDQLGGGFARYAVDRGWVVPHVEKMLYDNALLMRVCADRRTEPALWAGEQTAEFLLRELRTAEGGFASALDADSEGVEGRVNPRTPAQLVAVLGAEDGAWAADLFSVTPAGTFEHGTSVLQLRRDPDDVERGLDVRARLFEARSTRVRPARDDKVVAAWNGLAISGLARLGLWLEEPRYVDAATAAAELLLDLHLVDGRLRRVSRDGAVGAPAGVLEDHGCVASGWLDLFQATGDVRWLHAATDLVDTALERFAAGDGGFHDTADDAESLVARPRDPSDNASPSGLSSLVHALVTAAAITGEQRYRQAADDALASVHALVTKAPRFAGWSLAAAVALRDGPAEVAVVGPPGARRDSLANRARHHPTAVVLVSDGPRDDVPLLVGREPVDGQPAAYVCRHHVCAAPVTDPADLVP
jgi:uncharacterized protein YyaL (SSP411 family)